jgi:hypothetical protein
MKTETHLVTALETLHVRARGPATGGIWLETGGAEFPGAGWNDFIVVVLSWWSGAILRLLQKTSDRERVHFMDGPYAVELLRMDGELQLRMFAGPSEGREVAVGVADMRRFVVELTTQSRRLLDECRLREWWSPDAETLASCVHDLERELYLDGEVLPG